MRTQKCYSQGLTLIELLLVVSLFSIIAVATTPFYSRFVLQTNLSSTSDRVIGSLRKAQQYSIDNKSNLTWGVCLLGDTLRMHGGSCESPVVANNFEVPGSIALSGISSVTFNERGEPSSPLVILIESAVSSKTVTVNAAGGIE